MVDPMNIDEIYDAIQKLVSDELYRNEMSEGALRKAASLTLRNRTYNIMNYIDKRAGVWKSEN